MAQILPILLQFAGLLLVVYIATLGLYFAVGHLIEWMNRRNPERRIQKQRRGETRKRIEMVSSTRSILVTSSMVAIGIFAQWKGIAPAPWRLTWWNAVPSFVLTMVLFDAWFYFGHRLLHTRAFYRFHREHHRSIAPTVWSNDAIGVVDTAICQGFYAVIVFVVPIPPLILIANRVFDHFNGTFGHAGFEYFASATSRHPSPMLCTTYHDQHHEHFRYNYSNYFSCWDRLLGTVAPDYDRRVAEFERSAPPLKFRLLDAAASSTPRAGE